MNDELQRKEAEESTSSSTSPAAASEVAQHRPDGAQAHFAALSAFQAKPIAKTSLGRFATVQRKADDEETVQQQPDEQQSGKSTTAAPTGGAPSLPSSGSPLPDELRSKMEGSLGADFSDVRVAESAAVTQLGALAFAQGNMLHFAPGQYAPDTTKGQKLIGHELTHVVQQRGGRVKPTATIGGMPVNDDPALEAEADRLGDKAAAGTTASAPTSASAPTTAVQTKAIQRKKKTDTTPKAEVPTSSTAPEPVTIPWYTPRFTVTFGKSPVDTTILVSGEATLTALNKDGTSRVVSTEDISKARIQIQTVAKQVALNTAAKSSNKSLKSFKKDFADEKNLSIATLAMPLLDALDMMATVSTANIVQDGGLKGYKDVEKAIAKEEKDADKKGVEAKEDDTGLGQVDKSDAEKAEDDPSLLDSIVVTSGQKKNGETVTATLSNYELRPGIVISGANVTGVWSGDTLKSITDGTGTVFINTERTSIRVVLSGMTGNLKKGRVSGTGTFRLYKDLEIGKKSGVTFNVSKTSNGSVTIEDNDVTRFDGTVKILATDSLGDYFEVELTDAGGTAKAAKKLSGEGTATLLRPVELIEGIGPNSKWNVYLSAGSGITAGLELGKLTKFGGQIVLGIAEGDDEFARVMVAGQADYKPGKSPKMSMTGVGVEIVRPVHIADVGDWQVWSAPAEKFGEGINLTASFTDSVITSFGGVMPIELRDSEGPAIRIAVGGDYDLASGNITGTGSAKLLRNWKAMENIGPWGTWDLVVNEESEVTASMAGGALTQVTGNLSIDLLNANDKVWLHTHTEAAWDTQANTLDFLGSAAVLVDEAIYTGTNGDLYLNTETYADIEIRQGEVKNLNGTLGLSLQEGDTKFAKASFSGMYTAKDQSATGTATGTYLKRKEYFPADGTKVIVAKDTSASFSFDKSAFTNISGTDVGLRMQRVEGDSLLDVDLKGSADFDITNKNLKTADATVTLKNQWKFNKRFTFRKFEATAKAKDNALESISGKLYGSVFDTTGTQQLFDGFIDGAWTKGVFTGKAGLTLSTDQTFDLVKGVTATVEKKKTKGTVAFVEGALSTFSGGISVKINKGDKLLTTLSAAGTYDIDKKNIVDLKAKAVFGKPMDLLGGKLTLAELSVAVHVKNNSITDAMGTAKLTSKQLNVKKANITVGWRTTEGGDQYYVKGDISWVFFQTKKKHLKGTLAAFYNWNGDWTARAKVDYKMDNGISGKGDVEVDNEFNVTVHQLAMGVSKKLADKDTLFDFNKNIDLLNMRLWAILRLTFGVSFGAKFELAKPLKLNGTFMVEKWQPTQEESGMTPEFTADVNMPMDFNFEAYVGAYLEAALDVFVASVGVGVEARLVFGVPIHLDPRVTLFGDKDGFGGVMSFAMSINPKLLMQIIPYMFAEVVFVDPFETKMDPPIEIPLADLGSFSMEEELTFGDSKRAATAKKKRVAIDNMNKKEETIKKDKPGKNPGTKQPNGGDKSVGKDVGLDGGDSLPGNDMLAGQENKAGDAGKGSGDATQSKMEDVEDVLKGLKAIDEFMDFLGDVWDAIKTGGAAGVIFLAWEVFRGRINFSKLGVLWDDFVDGLTAAGRLLKGINDDPLSMTYRMGRWLTGEISTWDLIMGADDEVVEMVNNGVHKEEGMDAEQYGGMLAVLGGWDNYCGTTEEWAIIKIMREAGKRGHLKEALKEVHGSMYDGADQILWKLDGETDTKARAIFKKYGINHG